MSDAATVDDVNRMRDIALKFFRGNHSDNRQGYLEAGMVEELEELRYKICQTLIGPDVPQSVELLQSLGRTLVQIEAHLGVIVHNTHAMGELLRQGKTDAG